MESYDRGNPARGGIAGLQLKNNNIKRVKHAVRPAGLKGRGRHMSATAIIYLIIQIAAGAIGGNIFAKITQFTLGILGNSIVGAVGGAIGGFIFQGLGPELTSTLSIGSILLQAAIGAISGAILTVFASLFMHPIDY